MHSISALAAGISGAANGWARLFVHGTSTRAVYYVDFDGLVSVHTGADVTLDANGGAEVYVDGIVDVSTFTSAGVLLRSFTAGDMASAVQYKGSSFTGVDPVTAASGPSLPVSVKTVLDLALASFGARDFLVSFGGADRNLYQVLAGLGAFYNVKDPLYGAVGNGATDDTAAINAAISAANSAGGGIVFLPAGTYKTSAAINGKKKVSLLGAGALCTAISQADGTAVTLDFVEAADSLARAAFVRGLSFKASISNTGTVINVGASDLVIDQCQIGDGTNLAGILVGHTGAAQGKVTIQDCDFKSYISKESVSFTAAGGDIVIDGCRFVTATTHNAVAVLDLNTAKVSNCKFTNTATTVGTYSCIKSRNCQIDTCDFSDAGGATVRFIEYSSGTLFEDGNKFGGGAGSTAYVLGTTNAQLENIDLLSRENRWIAITDNGDPVTLPCDQYGSITLLTDGSADTARTYRCEPGPVGGTCKLFFLNESGVNIAISVVCVAREAAGSYTAFAGTVNNQKKEGLMLTSVPRTVGTGIPFGVVWVALGSDLTP